MPAPSRRNVGASLTEKIAGARHTANLSDRRDRQAADRGRHEKDWAAAAARLGEPTEPVDTREEPWKHGTAIGAPPLLLDRRAWLAVLAVPCPRHGAAPGEPCKTDTARWLCSGRYRNIKETS